MCYRRRTRASARAPNHAVRANSALRITPAHHEGGRMQAGTWLPLQAMAAWKATGTLHRAPTSTGATVHAEGALAPVVTAIVGVMRGARGPRARLEGRPALERVPASLPAGVVALAPRFAGGLRDGTAANGCRNTCGKEARH